MKLNRKKGRTKKVKPILKPKNCKFCANKDWIIDYKDLNRLRNFVSERGRIIPRRISGNCAKHQRELTVAIKRARQIALLPYLATSIQH